MSKIKNLKLRYKIGVGVATAGAIAAAGGAAFAYFGTSSTGTGSATTGSQVAWSISNGGTTGATSLVPDGGTAAGSPKAGDNVQTHAFTVTNNSGVTEHLTSVTISIAKADGSAWTSQNNSALPECSASDFSVGGSAVNTPHVDTAVAGDVAANGTSAGTVTVELIDNNLDQSNCEGVTVPLYLVAAP